MDVERLLFGMVAKRALAPRSKLSLKRWMGKHAWIEGLPEAQVHQLSRARDSLVKHGEEIQKTVFFSTFSSLKLEASLLFSDTTTIYFEIYHPEELRRYGDGILKDESPDGPRVVVGLAVTREALPVGCWVYPGNASDSVLKKGSGGPLTRWAVVGGAGEPACERAHRPPGQRRVAVCGHPEPGTG